MLGTQPSVEQAAIGLTPRGFLDPYNRDPTARCWELPWVSWLWLDMESSLIFTEDDAPKP